MTYRLRGFFALASGRQVDAQPLDLDMTDVQGGTHQARIAGAEGEMAHREGRRAGLDVVRIDGQVFARDLEPAEERNVKCTQLHPAVETGGKALQ